MDLEIAISLMNIYCCCTPAHEPEPKILGICFESFWAVGPPTTFQGRMQVVLCVATHIAQTANDILQNSNIVIKIVSQWAPSISNISNDFKRIWN